MDDPAAELLRAVDEVVAPWVRRSVERVVLRQRGEVPDEVASAAAEAGERARREVVEELQTLLGRDVDAQPTNPLSVLRGAVRHPTGVLRAAGARPVARDDFSRRAFPDDDYDLSPATWRDVDDRLHAPGIVWGAWKARTVLDRRRAEGRR